MAASYLIGINSNKQIAAKLHISEWTVKTYMRNIFVKLNVHNRAGLAYRCALLTQNHRINP